MTIFILWKRKSRQVAWTLGVCPWCGGLEAVRVEEVTEVVSVWFVPVRRSVVGSWTRCDFCERPMTTLITPGSVGFDEWNPADGLDALCGRLDFDTATARRWQDQDEGNRLRSLLGSVGESTSLHNLDVSLGLTTGLILGGLLGLIVGLLVIPGFDTGLDRIGGAFAGVFGGLLLGAVLGGVISVLVGQRSVPLRRLGQVCRQYNIPIPALEKVAGASCSRVRNAVGRLQDELAFSDHGLPGR